jgi:hypothetical protein
MSECSIPLNALSVMPMTTLLHVCWLLLLTINLGVVDGCPFSCGLFSVVLCIYVYVQLTRLVPCVRRHVSYICMHASHQLKWIAVQKSSDWQLPMESSLSSSNCEVTLCEVTLSVDHEVTSFVWQQLCRWSAGGTIVGYGMNCSVRVLFRTHAE